MAYITVQSETVGRVYAQSLINLATRQDALGALAVDVQTLQAVLSQSPQLQTLAQSASVSPEQKFAVLEKALTGHVHPLTMFVLRSMTKRDRLAYLDGFVFALDKLLKKLGGIIDVIIESAIALDESVQERIVAGIAKATGKVPALKCHVVPDLLGGLRIQIDDVLMDATVASHLAQLRKMLVNEVDQKLRARSAALV
ncbi:MAG: ATP synthase F1 subunit delta [Phycisphaerae bacterium]